ncbi:MAG TPA: hypothetical protein DIS78_07570 [Lachnospiraceae bacterium]|nr:hypothetical protein [Lachnospiraceae bacterium]
MKTCCVIIPIYNTIPTENEKISIKRNCTVLKDYDIFFVQPFLMNSDAYEVLIAEIYKDEMLSRPDESISISFDDHIHFRQFKNKYFRSNKTYSRLLLSEDFYRQFIDYEYMLIAQTDTYILNTDHTLDEFIQISRERSYDYWGAVWPEGPFNKPYTLKDRFKLMVVKEPRKLRVGNGGFSLRHIVNTINLIRRRKNLIDLYWRFNEDMFFSWFAYVPDDKYRAASEEEAYDFALEANMKEEIERGRVPYAVHAWEKYYPELIMDTR